MATSLTAEAKQLTDLRTVKRLVAAAGGMFGAHALAHLKFIPGGNAGWIGIVKLAGATVFETWLTDKFLPAYAEPVLEGGGLLTVLEIIGLATKGKLGAVALDDTAPAALSQQKQPAAQIAAAQNQNTGGSIQASNLNTTIGDDAASAWTNSGV